MLWLGRSETFLCCWFFQIFFFFYFPGFAQMFLMSWCLELIDSFNDPQLGHRTLPPFMKLLLST